MPPFIFAIPMKEVKPMNSQCFSYRAEKKGRKIIREYCDCLFSGECEGCNFYKDKDSLKMVVVKKQTQYQEVK